MGLVELLAIAAVGLVALLVGVVVLVARRRDRRNQVVPGVPTSAPRSWAGSHVPAARLHRRLRAAVEAAATAAEGRPELDGALRAVEEEALAVDERLVAAAAVAERERGPLLVEVAEQVAAVERAAVALARGRLDVAAVSVAVEDALTQVRLLAEAREEVERIDRGDVVPPEPPAQPPPPRPAPAPPPFPWPAPAPPPPSSSPPLPGPDRPPRQVPQDRQEPGRRGPGPGDEQPRGGT